MGDDNRDSPKGQMIAMIDIKAEIKARIAEGAKYNKGVTIRITHIGEYNENGIATVTCNLFKEVQGELLPFYVPRMLQVDAKTIANAQAKATRIKATIDAVKANDAKADVTELEKSYAEADAYAKGLVIDTFIEGESNTIFLTTVDFISTIANKPETAFAAKYLRGNGELLTSICNFCTTNLLTEKVQKNMLYNTVYSENVHVVPNASFYWSIIGMTLHEEGAEFLAELKAADKAERIKAAMAGVVDSKKKAISQRNDDDD